LPSSLRGSDLISTGIHESAHLAMYRITNGASLRDEFRFFDEGFADIIQSSVNNKCKLYKQRSLYAANIEMENGNLSFALLQNWTKYYGAWKSPDANFPKNPNAYPVGASFVFFMMDIYGEEKWQAFLIHIGQTKELASTLAKVTGKNIIEIEKGWKEYILNHKNVSASIPRIVEQFPANGADDVDPHIREIFVKFDQEMDTNKIVFINDSPDFGFSDAYWKDEKTLSISLKKGLTPNMRYNATLGSDIHGLLLSAIGCKFPETTWTFKTR
jgi:hypothetical protein